MISFWVFTSLYFIILLLGIKYFNKIDGYVSTFAVFGVTGFFYYLAVPIECIVTGNDFIALGDKINNPLSDNTKIAIAIMSVLAIIGFGIGLKCSGFTHSIQNSNSFINQNTQPVGFIILIVFSFILLLILFRDKIVSSGTYEGNVDTSYNNPFYTLLVDWIVITCSIIAGAVIIKTRRVKILSIVYLIPGIYWGIYASTKDQLLLATLGLLTFYTVANPVKNILLFMAGFIVIILFAPLALLWFSLYRSGVTVNIEVLKGVLDKGIIRNTDPAGPIAVFNDLYNSEITYNYGSTYLESIYLLIPKFIWSSRPLDIAEKYAQETLSMWLPGQGLGYSLLIEGYLNFSYFGVLFQYFMVGLLWGVTWKVVKKIVSKISVFVWLSLYAVFGFFLLIIIHRSPSSGTPKQLFLTIPVFLIFLVLFQKKIKLK